MIVNSEFYRGQRVWANSNAKTAVWPSTASSDRLRGSEDLQFSVCPQRSGASPSSPCRETLRCQHLGRGMRMRFLRGQQRRECVDLGAQQWLTDFDFPRHDTHHVRNHARLKLLLPLRDRNDLALDEIGGRLQQLDRS